MKISRAVGLGATLAACLVSMAVAVAASEGETCEIAGTALEIRGDMAGFDVRLECKSSDEGVEFATLTLTSQEAVTPPAFSLNWSVPSVNIAGVWTPAVGENNVIPADWSSHHLESTLTRHAPVLSLFGHNDSNRLTFAVSDATNHLKLSARIREEDGRIYNTIEFFSQPHPDITDYTVQVRIDRTDVPFYKAISAVADWWSTMPEYEPAYVPDAAREVMYSTWYSYHQQIDHDSLLAEVEAASKLGFGAIIVDDGWQTLDNNRGYAFTGDWEPERLPRMAEFVDAVHEHDMNALLWYSLPFVGEESAAAKRFTGKFLSHRESLRAYVLDPRYPEVREFLIGHYVHAVKDWGWDGLKLDFIDQFRSDASTDLSIANGRDYASVYDAVDRLMTDTINELRAINPDVMIEFRQRYIGPAMRKYGNMFRATDIPNGAVTNRYRIANLRFQSGDTPVHSDMLMWHPDEPVEVAALQYLNVLFSVPQISVRLNEIPEDHLEMIRHYTWYWNENKAILLGGDFAASGATGRYPLLQGTLGSHRIVGLYDDHVVEIEDAQLTSIDVVNGKLSEEVVVDAWALQGRYEIQVLDCRGEEVSRELLDFAGNVHKFNIPAAGLLKLRLLVED